MEAEARHQLSSTQERMWFIELLRPGTAVHNLAAAMVLHGPLRVDALRAAIDGMVMRHELSVGYQAGLSGLPPLPLPAVQYADFVRWERERLGGDESRAAMSYWTEALGGELPVLSLPVDRPRPPRPTFGGATVRLSIDDALVRHLHRYSRRANVPPFAVLATAFHLMLAHVSGQPEIVVGTPFANRGRPEFEAVIGAAALADLLAAERGAAERAADIVERAAATAA